MNNTEALELVQKCLDDWPYAATRVVDIMTRLEKVKELLKEHEEVKRKISPEGVRCGKCDRLLRYDSVFCDKCGTAVKHND